MAKKTPKTNKDSGSPTDDSISELKKIFPNVFRGDKIDFEKLKKQLEASAGLHGEDTGFSWAGKADSWKNANAPTRGTLIPKKGESINFDGTENIFVEADNLEAMKLLRRSYGGKIKMIYIDPPYNTGNDFVYNDYFENPLQNYLEQTGQTKGGVRLTTNPETSGRFHSDWLTMMFSRLTSAWKLLKEENGIIFVSIGDGEIHNLRIMMDEIFGEDNFLADIIWNSTKTVTNTALISDSTTHNLVYAKNKEYFIENRSAFRLPETEEGFSNPDNDPRGPWKADPFQVGGLRPNQLYEIKNLKTGKIYKPNPNCSWKNEFKVFQQLSKDGRIVFGTSGEAGPQRKRFLSEALERGRVAKTLWTDVPTTADATRDLKKLMGDNVFNNPKPVDLIQRFIQLGAPDENDVVCDYFAGSGTTGHAVWEQNRQDKKNRKFILIQLPELCDKESQAYKAGYETIADICKERIRRAAKKIKEESRQQKLTGTKQDLGFKVFRLAKSNYRIWEDYDGKDADELKKQAELFSKPLVDGYDDTDVIYEVIVKEGYGLNSRIEKADVSTNMVYRVTDDNSSFFITLDAKIDAKTLDRLDLSKDTTLVCIDDSLDDSQKNNISMRCNLKTI